LTPPRAPTPTPPTGFARFADAVLSHRVAILAALGALTLLMIVQFRLLRFDFQPSAMMQFSDDERAFSADFSARYHDASEDTLLLILHSPQPQAVLSPYGLSLLHQLTELAQQSGLALSIDSLALTPDIPDIPDNPLKLLASSFTGRSPSALLPQRPATDADVSRVLRRLDRSSLLRGSLISADGAAALIVLHLDPRYRDLGLLSPALADLEAAVEAAVAHPDFSTASPAPSLSLQLGGLPYIRTETVRNLKRDQLVFWPVVGAVFFLMLLALFRSPLQALLPLISVGLATAWIVGLLATINQEVNIINNIMPTLILVVGICDGIHVVLRANKLRAEGRTHIVTARDTIAELGLPCLLTTLTSAIGFASLVVARADVLRSFGWQVGLGIMLAYVCVILLVPIALSFQRRAQVTVILSHADVVALDAQPRDRIERLLARLTDHLLAYPRAVLVIAVATLALTAAIGARVPIDAFAIEAFHEGHPIYEANRLIEQKLGGVLPLELEVQSPAATPPADLTTADGLTRLAALQDMVARQPNVLQTISILDILAEARAATDGLPADWRRDPSALAPLLPLVSAFQPALVTQYLSADHDRLRLTARMSDAGIRNTIKTLQSIQGSAPALNNPPPEGAAAAPSPVTVRPTGAAYLTAIGLDLFVRDLFWSLITASLIIFGILVLFFRSWRVGIISLIPNLLPLTTTLALMPALGYDLNTSSVVIFTISIGLAVDNTIHFVARLREVRPDYASLDEAIRAAFSSSGRAIIASNVLLMIGFSVLFLSDFEPTRRVATLTVITIFSALIAAILVLPALLHLLYEKSPSAAPVRVDS
jgi:predicted RND superfamily exporter protein